MKNKLIVEARNADGSLNLDIESPPTWMLDTTEDKLFDWAFAQPEHKKKNTMSLSELQETLADRGWKARAKTW